MINIVEDWGISTENYLRQDSCNSNDLAIQNSCIFNNNIDNGQELYLPAGTYLFNRIEFKDVDNVEFYGESNTIIKFNNKNHNVFEINNADNFNIHDLIIDGSNTEPDGGIWATGGATNGVLKNLEIRDAFNVSCVIGGHGTHDVTVEDCTVYGQRGWSGNAKAMFLAGDFAEEITFKNCKTYSKSYYKPSTDYSPADHFDSDNGRNIEYHNCIADGTGTPNTRRGVGFWNEAYNDHEYHETSSTYYNCTAIKTDGGLAGTENSDVVAHNFTFIECSYTGWAVWARGLGNFELYDSLFDGCFSIGPYGIKRGGFIIEGAPDGKFIKFKRNKFINTPPGLPHYDNINLYCPEDYTGDIEIFDNTFDANVTANTGSHAKNPVYVYWNIFEGSDSDLLKHESYTDYVWHVLKAARTTAINNPTSNATVTIDYGGHSTFVNIPSGVNFGTMLIIFEGTINNDFPSKITAEANSTEKWLTFKQKASNPDTTVNIIFNFSEWQNGSPFDDLNPVMTP